MTLPERVFEDLAADLEYHPKRAAIYLGLGVAALSFWVSLPSEKKLEVAPIVCGLGGVVLVLKGMFLLRRSSEGLGLTAQEIDQLSSPANRKELPATPMLLAQLIQDFGTGALVLGPVLHFLKKVNEAWEVPIISVPVSGAILVALGWLIRRFAGERAPGAGSPPAAIR